MAGLLDLGILGSQLAAQDERREKRQDADLVTTTKRINLTQDAARRSAAVTDQARAAAEAGRREQLEILSGVDDQVAKAKTAIELSNSKNPMDRLKLWMLQQTDKSYTRAGNLERIQYFQSAASALGDQSVLEQAGFADSLSAIEQELNISLMEDEGDLELLKLQEQQGAELIDAMVANQQIKLGQMQTNQAMQETALADMTREQLEVAAESAKKSGTANVSGIEVSLPDIENRLNAVKDREYLMHTRELEKAELVLADQTLDDLNRLEAEAKNSKDARVSVGGTSISLARIQERKVALTSQNYNLLSMEEGQRNMATNRRRETEQRIINTFSVPELNKFIMNGGVDETTGHQYDMDQLVSARDVKASTQANMLQQDMALASVGNPGQLAVDHNTYLSTIKAAPGSQLSQIIETQRHATNVAASFIMSEDPMQRLMSIQAIQNSRVAVDEAIAAEAKRLSAGDKDLELALSYQLRGQAVPADVVSNAIVERVTKGQPIGQWLSPQNRGLFTTTYHQSLNDIAMSNPLLDKKTQQQMAVDVAMTQVMNAASAGITDELLTVQFEATDNPLKGVVSPATFLTIVKRADEQGARQYQMATGLDDKAMAERLSGTTGDPQLAASQTAQLYMELEKIKPGLGRRYVEWWSTPYVREMVGNYVGAKSASFSDMSQLSEFSLVAPTLQDQMTQYGVLVAEGENVMYGNQLATEQANYVTFGGSPEAKQVFLLEQDKSLTPIEKQQAFALLIKPLLSEVANQKMNQQQASTWIEQQLRTMQPSDPTAKKLRTKLMTGRSDALKVVDDFINIQTQRRAIQYGLPGGRLNDPGLAEQFNKQAVGFDWYREMQGN